MITVILVNLPASPMVSPLAAASSLSARSSKRVHSALAEPGAAVLVLEHAANPIVLVAIMRLIIVFLILLIDVGLAIIMYFVICPFEVDFHYNAPSENWNMILVDYYAQ